jgi:hypothetical protein
LNHFFEKRSNPTAARCSSSYFALLHALSILHVSRAVSKSLSLRLNADSHACIFWLFDKENFFFKAITILIRFGTEKRQTGMRVVGGKISELVE